jgi:hypothetical protein
MQYLIQTKQGERYMYSKPQHDIDEALKKFDLIGEVGDGQTTACAMSMLGWLAGHEKWTDAPVCASPDIATRVITANDWEDPSLPRFKTEDPYDDNYGNYTKHSEDRIKARRANLVKLGYEGALDTWWIPDEIITWLLETTENGNPYENAVSLLKATAKWKKTRHKMSKQYDETTGEYIWLRVS